MSGSPWSISLAWPETADNCGRAVSACHRFELKLEMRSSYRVYRDNNLIHPLSNGFVGTPALVGMECPRLKISRNGF